MEQAPNNNLLKEGKWTNAQIWLVRPHTEPIHQGNDLGGLFTIFSSQILIKCYKLELFACSRRNNDCSEHRALNPSVSTHAMDQSQKPMWLWKECPRMHIFTFIPWACAFQAMPFPQPLLTFTLAGLRNWSTGDLFSAGLWVGAHRLLHILFRSWYFSFSSLNLGAHVYFISSYVWNLKGLQQGKSVSSVFKAQ